MKNNDIKKIKQRIDSFDVVSFDIFDTLVLRNVFEPVDIFKAVEVRYKSENNGTRLADGFYKERVEAEHRARIKKSNQEDIVFDDIYEELSKKYPTVFNQLKALEIEVEFDFIVKNEAMFEVFQYAKLKNKKIILISDMYLPKDILSRLMSKLEYSGFEDLFVSCESMKTKHFGTLYEYVKSELGLDYSNWVHIGDNYHSDVVNAEKHGISSFHYKKLNERESDWPEINSLDDSIFTAIEINRKYTNSKINYWYEFGYNNLGRLFYSFNYWMVKNLNRNVNEILFLARDGYLPQKIYNEFRKFDSDLPQNKYLYTSRRAYQWPTVILEQSDDEIIQILTGFNPQFNQKLTLSEVFKSIGLNENDYIHLIDFYSLPLDKELCLKDGSHNLAKKVIKDLLPIIKEKLNEEKRILLQYVHQEINDENVAIVDIGWRGSIQKSIQLLLEKPIQGYYFSTNPFVHEEVRKFSKGFLADIGIPADMNEFSSKYLMIFELAFTAPHGTLTGFKKENNTIIPILEDENSNPTFISAVSAMQNGCMACIKDILKYRAYIQEVTNYVAIKRLKYTLDGQKLTDLLEFSKISNYVGFGAEGEQKKYVTVYDYDYQFSFENSVSEATFNLWPGAFLIKDSERYITCGEYYRLYLDHNGFDLQLSKNTVNLELEMARKIYRYFKCRGLKSSILRAIYSIKYIFSEYRNRKK